jgi:hypothetical protein
MVLVEKGGRSSAILRILAPLFSERSWCLGRFTAASLAKLTSDGTESTVHALGRRHDAADAR